MLALALFAVSLAAPLAGAVERSEVAEKYKWKLTDLYPTTEAWQAARTDIARRIPELGRFQGKLGGSGAALFEALDTRMAVDKDLGRLSVYASMQSDEDTRIAKNLEMRQAAEKLQVDYGSAVSYMRPEILALGPEKVKALVASEPRLKPYAIYLDDITRWAPHTLDPAQEKIVAKTGDLAGAGHDVFNVFSNAELPYPEVTLSDGQKVRIDAQGYTRYRAAANREDRMKVFKAFWGAYKGFEGTCGQTVAAQVKAHVFNKDVRNYQSCLQAATFPSNVPVQVYTQLITDVNANLPTLHRYLKLRQRMMGIDQLRYEDLYAPITQKADLRYTPEQAIDLVLKGCAPLGPQYTAALKKSFDERWVDWMPTPGKRSGAYSTGAYDVHPYQLQNFTGLYDEVSTVAHESGHSMHTYLSAKNQPYVTADYPIFVAEVASTCNEALLLDYMLKNTKDKDTRLFLLGSRLDNLRTTLFRQTLFAEFELKMHELAEKGEPISGAALSKMYIELLKRYYGDAQGVCKVDDLYGIEWAYIPHFYYNFYVYQYATSIVASSTLANGILSEASAKKPTTQARDAYLKLLSSGSSKYAVDLLKDAGVDMTTSAPFNSAIAEMNRVMDEMEKLLK
jgi:oligoendopeptidase F